MAPHTYYERSRGYRHGHGRIGRGRGRGQRYGYGRGRGRGHPPSSTASYPGLYRGRVGIGRTFHNIGRQVRTPIRMRACEDWLAGNCSGAACVHGVHALCPATAPTCARFLAGVCGRGSQCKLRHVAPNEYCLTFAKNGYCALGNSCARAHTFDCIRRFCRGCSLKHRQIEDIIQAQKGAFESENRGSEKVTQVSSKRMRLANDADEANSDARVPEYISLRIEGKEEVFKEKEFNNDDGYVESRADDEQVKMDGRNLQAGSALDEE